MKAHGRGFTIVELMVALVIGMALTIVLAQLFINSRRTYATTDDVGRMQENLRYTYQLFARTVHLAGYRSSPSTDPVATFATDAVISGVDSGSTLPDSFTVAFQGSSNGTAAAADNTVVNCFGQPVPAGTMSVNAFTIAVGKNGANALFCNGTEIVADVENMQVLYGVDTNDDVIVDQYVKATGLSPNNVRTVRIAMLFKTPTAGVVPPPTDPAAGRVYTLNDVTLPAFNDTYARRVMNVTIALRNRTP